MTQNGLIFESGEYRNKFRVAQALWNPKLDVLALANQSGEICLKRFYWKTGWQVRDFERIWGKFKRFGEVLISFPGILAQKL